MAAISVATTAHLLQAENGKDGKKLIREKFPSRHYQISIFIIILLV